MRIFLIAFFIFLQAAPTLARTYDLEIKRKEIFGVDSIAINGTIPGPTLYFEEGDEAIINVKNALDEKTSIHWHGILLPGNMDGVPGLNGFEGISAGQTFTYKFKIRQKGTYWYHSHSNLQEQEGMYGALVIGPSAPKEFTIVLSDFTRENPRTILNNLKIDSGYYNYGKRTIFTFFDDVKKHGFFSSLKDRMMWGEMRMDATDLADVTKYSFLLNGRDDWTGIIKSGEPVRLRFINAAAMSFFDVSIPGLKMKLIEADGQMVKPVTIDEFRIGPAETYDVIVTPQNKAYRIFAESLDRMGYATGIIAPKEGMLAEIPKMRPRTILSMKDMAMDHEMIQNEVSGWENASTPAGHKALSYRDLVSKTPQKDLREPQKEIEFKFGGNMVRYIWTINGEKFPKPFHLKFGERVRLKFTNETMMAHPIHLHGMFMQLENGQAKKWMPNKHTVIIPPAQSITTLLTADEEGEWAFHCHLLFHMASGMMTSVVVEKTHE